MSITETNDEARTSIAKALELLECFISGQRVMGVSELARQTRMPKTTTLRVLESLVRYGYVERRDSRYCLGRKAFELGSYVSTCRRGGLRDVALPFLSDLYERTHQVVHLAVLSDTDVLYLEKIHGHESIATATHVGGRFPASCSALGKAMLAFGEPELVQSVVRQGLVPRTPYTIASVGLFLAEMDRIRETRVAFDREEAALGLSCVAAPIMRGDAAVAAVSVSCPSGWSPERYTSAVTAAARAIEQRLVVV
jgi:DNA-binding IclR family transcriptional regulator